MIYKSHVKLHLKLKKTNIDFQYFNGYQGVAYTLDIHNPLFRYSCLMVELWLLYVLIRIVYMNLMASIG